MRTYFQMVSGSSRFRAPMFAILLTMLAGCGTGINLYSTQDDINLGSKMQAEIAKDPKTYPVLNDARVTGYVQGIVNRIVQSPNVKNKNFRYQVTVIHDDKTVNAFAIPGGPIYVYTGLMKYIDDEATLAGVLAHEITHVDHRHGSRQMSEQYGIQIISGLALGNNPGTLATIAANLGTQLTVLKFTRADESEADAGSFDDLYQMPGRPWYPAAINAFMTKSKNLSGSNPGAVNQLFLTHPPSQERFDAVAAMAKKVNLPAATSSQLNAQGYSSIRAMLP